MSERTKKIKLAAFIGVGQGHTSVTHAMLTRHLSDKAQSSMPIAASCSQCGRWQRHVHGNGLS